MKLQETESPKEPYNVQLSVKPIYSPVDDLLKKIHLTTGVENSYKEIIFLNSWFAQRLYHLEFSSNFIRKKLYLQGIVEQEIKAVC